MGIVTKEDIVGIIDGRGFIKCAECMDDGDWNNLRSDDVTLIIQSEIEMDDEHIYICDAGTSERCLGQMN